MENINLEQLKAEWKKLSAPELLERIDLYRTGFAEEEKRLREAGKTPFNSEISYYKPLLALFDELDLRLCGGEEITLYYNVYVEPCTPSVSVRDIVKIPKEVRFTSDPQGNFYFDGNKVIVEYDPEWAYRLRKTYIKTNCRRPVDFYLEFLDPKSKYTPNRNIFGDTCEMICEKYKKK